MGMINKIVESDKLLEAAIDYAELLASGPRDAIVWTKYCVNKLVKQNAHLLLDTSIALETITFNSPERREAVACLPKGASALETTGNERGTVDFRQSIRDHHHSGLADRAREERR
jgi:hypothetical protein